MHAFWDGFEKQAINIATARAAVGRIKGNLIRRGMRFSEETMQGIAGAKPLTLAKDKRLPPVGPAVNVPGLATSVAHPGADRKIFAQGDSVKILQGAGLTGEKAMNPRNREMTNRILLLHEQAERKALGAVKDPTIWTGMHADPKVIMQEGNALASLPKGYGNTRETFQNLRDADGTRPALEHVLPGYEYGKTRLSRHAIKHVQELAKEKGLAPKKIKDL